MEHRKRYVEREGATEAKMTPCSFIWRRKWPFTFDGHREIRHEREPAPFLAVDYLTREPSISLKATQQAIQESLHHMSSL